MHCLVNLGILSLGHASQEATFRTEQGKTDWFQIGKGVCQGCILSPCLFNLHAEYIMRNAGLDEAQAGINIARSNINNLRHADDTTLMAESKEQLKSLLIQVQEENEKVGLKLNIQKTKIMASISISSVQFSSVQSLSDVRIFATPWAAVCQASLSIINFQSPTKLMGSPITSWQVDGEIMETVTDFILGGSKITADGDCSHEIKRGFLLGRKVMTKLDSILKSRDISLPRKVCLVKAMVFPVVMCRCESWTIKKAEH